MREVFLQVVTYMSAPVNQCMALVVYLGCRTPGNIGFSLSKGEILPSSRTDRGVLVSGHRLQLQHLPGTLAWDALSPKAQASLQLILGVDTSRCPL